ncbi:Brp/Blh family beta-carotene 15,15'-dioxygenase [Longibacter salinarum]|uniref:Brp/Blh family beta-carotene 15,15'-dioxygenase n=1 Tax=Longibacter salinarum TaxID=1850348 RepID=UPI001FE7652B|nr:Brp/Blh family beta-carotene 15,15'-dioxygenase [Longibacter salinarum]
MSDFHAEAHHHEVTLRSPRIYVTVLGITLACAAIGAWGGLSLGPAAFAVLMVAVVVTGIPHGAVDHIVAAQLYGLSSSLRDQARFYGFYLAMMAVYGALWFVVPAWCLAAFLVMTMYHFGQADLAYWSLPSVTARVLYLSRGLLLVGLPIAAFPGIVDPIFDAIAGVQVSSWPYVATQSAWVCAALIVQHIVMLAVLLPQTPERPDGWWREFVNTAALSALFLTVHPLVAFAVYFGLWHSLGHILELVRFFNRTGEPTSLPGFYKKAALYTIISFAGLGLLYATTQSFGFEDQMVALLFILISVMTLPHMIIVEHLYQQPETSGTSPREVAA